MIPIQHHSSLIFMFLCFWSLSISAVFADNVSLDAYLNTVVKSSKELQAIDLDIQSLRFEIEARDLELSPTLDVELLRFWDDRPSTSSNRQTSGHSGEVILNKPLATGTNLSLSSYLETADYLAPPDEQNLLNWQLGVSQSLWQNSFGRQTALRRQRDQDELRSRLLTLLFTRQELLIEFESLYWDIAYAREEVRIREENLERSHRISTWIQERFDRSAAEHVDLLQGQTLVASRELQLQLGADTLKTLQARLNEKLPENFEFIPQPEDLRKDRDIFLLPAQADFASATPVLIEALQSHAQADFLKAKSKLESDQLKPVLDIGYSYGQQGLSTSYSAARDQVFSKNNNYHQVGIVFSMPLDFILINKSRKATRLAAQAQELRSVKFRRQSDIQWEDLERTITEQKARVQTAMTLAKFQNEKSQEEHARYEKGRTTAFQAISFEQEAAESDLLVLQLLAQLRRTESQARMYIQKGEVVK